MKPLRATTAVAVIAWMCGALFALWLAYSAKVTAMAMAVADAKSWVNFLAGVPWIVVWLAIALVLALLAWGSASLALRRPCLVYGYAVLVVALCAGLYWLLVVLPPNSVLAYPL